jgi:hypothetical protein
MTPKDVRDFFMEQRAAKQPDWEPIERMSSDLSKYARQEEDAQRKRDAAEGFDD